MAYLGKSCESTFRLYADVGYGIAPIEGITFSQITLRIKKSGGQFVIRTLLETEWVENEFGFYSIRWTESDMDTLGGFIALIDYPYQAKQVALNLQIMHEPLVIDAYSPYCIVTGNMVDVGAAAAFGQSVVFRVPSVPVFTQTSMLSANIIRTVTDAFGNFSVKLLRGIRVLVEIEQAGIRYQITVPDQPTAAILDLLPPIPA